MLGKGSKNDIRQILDEGQADAFTNLYTQFFQKLLIESNKYVKDAQVAEEIVQDVFLKIWERSENLAQITSLKSYLYRAVINSSINYLNRQKSLEQHHQKIAKEFTEDDLDRLDEENEVIIKLFAEIEKLPPKCREIFKLNRFEHLKYKQIAEKLDISERTVENHIANALKILREVMLQDPKIKQRPGSLRVLMPFLFL